MSSLKNAKWVGAAGAGIALSAILIGCGGGGSVDTSAASTLLIPINWTSTKAVGEPQSVTIDLTNTGTQKAYEQIVNRAPDQAQQSAIFKGLPAGHYVMTAQAHDQANGAGADVSDLATSLDVTPGNMSTAALALAGSIKQIVIPDLPTTPTPGTQVQMVGYAKDASGNLLMLPSNQLQWSVNDNGFGATINDNGVLVVSAAGTITVTLSDPGSGESATVVVDVANPTTGGGTGGSTGATTGTTGATTGVTTGTTGA